MVEAEGTAFGAMAAARRRLRTENMGAGGQSSMVVSGTTLVKQYLFRRVSMLGYFYRPNPVQQRRRRQPCSHPKSGHFDGINVGEYPRAT